MKSLLCTLGGFSTLLLRRKEAEKADEKELKILREMVDAGQKLAAFTSDIHDFLKLEQPNRTLATESIQVSALLRSVSDISQSWLLMKKLCLEMACTPPSLSVVAEPRLLTEVLSHIVVAASRFATKESRISLVCSICDKKVLFKLSYSAPDFNEDVSSFLENPQWYQEDKGAFMQSGIGLPLCKSIATECGWELSFPSSSEIYLSIPL